MTVKPDFSAQKKNCPVGYFTIHDEFDWYRMLGRECYSGYNDDGIDTFSYSKCKCVI